MKKGVIIFIFNITCLLILFIALNSGDKYKNVKRVDGFIISKAEIEVKEDEEISFLKAYVKNKNDEDVDNVKFKITFYNRDNKVIDEVVGYLGNVKSMETIELNAAVSKKLVDVYDIKYELID